MPKAGILKICNYCKNHLKPGEKPVLEKHHRPCEKYNNQEHFKVCKPCARNYKKTENVRIWRAKKAQNKPSDNAIKNIVEELMKEDDIFEIVNHQQVDQIIDSDPSNPIEMTSDDYIIVEEPELIENEYVQSTELYVQNRKDAGFTLFIQHPLYPKMSLDEDDAMRFQSEIENLIDNMIGNGKTPKFISHVLENGMWRVTSADEYTNEWFKEKASTFTCLVDNTDVPVQVVPYNELPRFICSGLIPGKTINSDIIFSRIQKQNPGLNTSRWCICDVKQQERDFLISFKVDHLSLKKIQENNYMLNIGMNQVNLFICEETDEKVDEPLEQIEVC